MSIHSQPGEDFVETITRKVQECDVLLALMRASDLGCGQAEWVDSCQPTRHGVRQLCAPE